MPVIKEVQKLWGTELWHHNDSQYCMKSLVIQPGAVSSLHYHRVKRETFLVTRARVMLEVGGTAVELCEGDSYTIEPGAPHRFRTLGVTATVVEASTTHDDDDVVRIEPSKLL